MPGNSARQAGERRLRVDLLANKTGKPLGVVGALQRLAVALLAEPVHDRAGIRAEFVCGHEHAAADNATLHPTDLEAPGVLLLEHLNRRRLKGSARWRSQAGALACV